MHLSADKLVGIKKAFEYEDWLLLKGWSSCSLEYSVALGYTKTDDKDRVRIIFEIEVTYVSYPVLDNSNFPGEKEIVLRDHELFKVESISQDEEGIY